MEGDNLLDTIFDEESFEDAQDVEMHDVEDGELIEQNSNTEAGGSCDGGDQVNQESSKKNSRNKKKKKKTKRRRGKGTGPNVTNINRFVMDVCKRLRERKTYLVWTAAGCLGVSALSDLVKEVDAIQACGGQKIADGSRFRSGGGVLWNIIKARDPNAYKEIMRKGKEFEKQFKQQLHVKQEPKPQTEASCQSISLDNQPNCNSTDGVELASNTQSQIEVSTGQKRASVHDRIRLQVTYEDLLGGKDPKDESAPLK